MKTDTIFYRLFQAFPQTLFELLQISPQFVQNYRFDSVEVKQLSFRLDGVFLPTVSDAPIYFVEVQFQPDNTFFARFLSEICLYLYRNDLDNDWRGVVIFPSRRIDNSPKTHYWEFFESGRITGLYLDELAEILQSTPLLATVGLVTASQAEAIERGQELIERVRVEVPPPQQQDLLELVASILVYKLPQMSQQEIERMFSIDDLRQTRVYQEALQEGIEQGIEQGREQGREQERRDVVMSLLRMRFGSINSELEAIAPMIAQLPTDEFTPLLLQLSREELIARFETQTQD
jgi:predicted transposase/invertase (TIGR01784 family)